jgi:hypothetical protein
MTRRSWGALAGVLILIVAMIIMMTRGGEAPAAQKPRLLLLTSLPLLFGEGFALDAPPTPLIEALGKRYDVTAIDTSSAQSLARGRVLLMAQPRAQTPDNLVALDRWIRGGGHLVLFADPRLDWPSELPLGDLNRPPPMFADTGLLNHWGLRLDAPENAGPAKALLAAKFVEASSPGRLTRTGGACVLADDGIVARCVVGKGRVIVVADADLLATAANMGAVTTLVGDLD